MSSSKKAVDTRENTFSGLARRLTLVVATLNGCVCTPLSPSLYEAQSNVDTDLRGQSRKLSPLLTPTVSTMPTCRLLPQGSFPLVPTVLTSMAWVASLFQDECDYVRVEGDVVDKLSSQSSTPWIEAGVKAYRVPRQDKVTGEWEITYSGRCLEYPQEYVDTAEIEWKLSEAFAFISLVLGGSGTFFLWFSTCCTFSRGTWRLAGYEIFFASVFQGLAFLFFETSLCQENTCSLFWGSKSDILSVIFWLLAAMCMFCHYPVPRDLTEEPDGIMTTTDGSVTTATDDFRMDQVGKSGSEGESEMASGEASGQDGPTKEENEIV